METGAIQRKDPTLLRLSSEEENYGVIVAPPTTPIDINLPTFVELNENDFQAEQEKPGQSAVLDKEIEHSALKTNVLESLASSNKGSSLPEAPCGKDDETRKSFEEITDKNENTDSLRHEIPDGNANSKPKTQIDTAEMIQRNRLSVLRNQQNSLLT